MKNNNANIVVKTVFGKEILNYIPNISKIRLVGFEERPYLYNGNMEKEEEYVSGYSSTDQSALFLAYNTNKIVGFLIASPLADYCELASTNIQEIFNAHNIPLKDFYYCGEIIVLPQHRNIGVAQKIFAEVEKVAKQLGRKYLCLMTIKSEHQTPDNIGFAKFGFDVKKSVKVIYKWPMLDESGKLTNAEHKMSFWTKQIQ